MALKFYISVAKWSKIKVTKFLGLIFTFVEVMEEELVGEPFWFPILNRVIKRKIQSSVKQPYDLKQLLIRYLLDVKNKALFWSVFSRIWTGYGEIRSISPYSVRMRENTDQNNSEYGHSLRSVNEDSHRCVQNLLKYLTWTFFRKNLLAKKPIKYVEQGSEYDHGDIILNRSNNSQISIERSVPQQAAGFIVKYYFGISNISVCRQKKAPVAHQQTIDVQSCFTVPRYAFFISFPIIISKPEILN